MEPLIMGVLTTLLGILVGYLAGYAKKKGENRAIHEDIGKLTDQVAAVTKTAKEIEAKISNEMWDRQKQWELRREVFFQATKRLADISEVLFRNKALMEIPHVSEQGRLAWHEAKNEAVKSFYSALTAFDETRLFVATVCDKETARAFNEFAILTGQVADAINKGNTEVYDRSQTELAEKMLSVRNAIRKELRLDAD
jgi:hypothetical protein